MPYGETDGVSHAEHQGLWCDNSDVLCGTFCDICFRSTTILHYVISLGVNKIRIQRNNLKTIHRYSNKITEKRIIFVDYAHLRNTHEETSKHIFNICKAT